MQGIATSTSSTEDHLPYIPWRCLRVALASSIARWTLCNSVNPEVYQEEAPAYLLKAKWHWVRSHRTPKLSFSHLAGMALEKNRCVLPLFQTVKHSLLLRFDLGAPFLSPTLPSKAAVGHQERGGEREHPVSQWQAAVDQLRIPHGHLQPPPHCSPCPGFTSNSNTLVWGKPNHNQNMPTLQPFAALAQAKRPSSWATERCPSHH